MRLAFSDYAPDLADLDNPVAPTITNVIPGANSYRPIPGPSAYSDALASSPTGLWNAKTNAGDFKTFAATASTLEVLNGTSWTQIGSGFSPVTDEYWAGVQFGTEFFFNNSADGMYKFDIEAGSAVSAVAAGAQAAKHMAVVEEYLVAANTATSPREFAWSNTNAGSTWNSGNAGSQTFPDLGAITGVAGAANLIIQEEGLRRIIPDPGGDIFQFEKIEQGKGSIAPESIIPFGDAVAYLAEDGFWFRTEAESIPIGQNKVNRSFLNSIDQNQLYTVIGRADPTRPIFWWFYRTSESATYDQALIYNWRTQKWAQVSMSILFIATGATTGYTLETLSAQYPNIEEVPYPFDSRVWLGGRPVLSVIDTDMKLAFLEGGNLAATLDIGERQLIPGMRARIGGVRPLVNNANATIKVRTRERLGDSASFQTAVSQQTSGICPVNRGGRYHRFRMDIAAGEVWSHALGIEIPDSLIAPDGMR